MGRVKYNVYLAIPTFRGSESKAYLEACRTTNPFGLYLTFTLSLEFTNISVKLEIKLSPKCKSLPFPNKYLCIKSCTYHFFRIKTMLDKI